MYVVVLDDWNEAFSTSELIGKLRERVELVIHSDRAPSRTATLDRLAGADIVVANRERTRFPADLLAELPDLKMIAQTGDGIMHIDLPAATARGILVAAAVAGSHAGMVELTIGMMIAAMRRLAEQDRALRRGV